MDELEKAVFKVLERWSVEELGLIEGLSPAGISPGEAVQLHRHIPNARELAFWELQRRSSASSKSPSEPVKALDAAVMTARTLLDRCAHFIQYHHAPGAVEELETDVLGWLEKHPYDASEEAAGTEQVLREAADVLKEELNTIRLAHDIVKAHNERVDNVKLAIVEIETAHGAAWRGTTTHECTKRALDLLKKGM